MVLSPAVSHCKNYNPYVLDMLHNGKESRVCKLQKFGLRRKKPTQLTMTP